MEVDEALERSQWELFWVPPDVRVVERPELLYLASPQPDLYLNAVVRARLRDDQVEAAVAEVAEAHGRLSRWQLTPFSRTPALEGALARAGYEPRVENHAYALACDVHRPSAHSVEVRRVQSLSDLRAADQVSRRAFGREGALSDERLAIDLASCTRAGSPIHRFVAWLDDAPVAHAGLNVFPHLGVGLLWGGGTIPEARGRGVYAALLEARIAVARSLGIPRVALYARDTTSAPIVARRGFTRHGRMTLWER